MDEEEISELIKVLIDIPPHGEFTYETDLDVSIGDVVLLPIGGWMNLGEDVTGTWQGKVISLESPHEEKCKGKIIEIIS